jgi:hypothetical protein
MTRASPATDPTISTLGMSVDERPETIIPLTCDDERYSTIHSTYHCYDLMRKATWRK